MWDRATLLFSVSRLLKPTNSSGVWEHVVFQTLHISSFCKHLSVHSQNDAQQLLLNDATGSSVSFRNASIPSIKRHQQASINQVEYKGIMNASCQTKDGIRGIQNVDFVNVAGLSFQNV